MKINKTTIVTKSIEFGPEDYDTIKKIVAYTNHRLFRHTGTGIEKCLNNEEILKVGLWTNLFK